MFLPLVNLCQPPSDSDRTYLSRRDTFSLFFRILRRRMSPVHLLLDSSSALLPFPSISILLLLLLLLIFVKIFVHCTYFNRLRFDTFYPKFR